MGRFSARTLIEALAEARAETRKKRGQAVHRLLLFKTMPLETVNLEEELELLDLPWVVGAYLGSGDEMTVH